MISNPLKVDEDDRDSIMIQEAIWEIFKTERSYMNGVRNNYFRSQNITGSDRNYHIRIDVKPASDRRLIKIASILTYKYR